MRIDYNEPRQSSTASSGTARQRPSSGRKSSPAVLAVLFVGVCMFAFGFGVGWYFSQQSAKKAYRAAMEQQSIESAPKPLAPPQQAAQQPQSPAVPQGQPTQAPQQAAPAGQVPLSFFESLPKGQKQTVLGSGINEKPKPAPAAPPAQQPQQPATAPAAPAKPTAAKSGTPGFVVQVAAYSNQKEAEATKAKLAAKGYSASIGEISLGDKGTWYRVRVGRHLDKEAASEIATRIGSGAKVLADQE